MKLFEVEDEKGLTREEKKAVRKRMIELILHGFPNELSSGHEGQWFVLNRRNQVQWNWRVREYPFGLLIEKEFPHLLERWKKWRLADQYGFTNSVLNSKEVKQFKKEFKDVRMENVAANAYREFQQINHEIARLQARKEELEPLVKKYRRAAYAQKRQKEKRES